MPQLTMAKQITDDRAKVGELNAQIANFGEAGTFRQGHYENYYEKSKPNERACNRMEEQLRIYTMHGWSHPVRTLQ